MVDAMDGQVKACVVGTHRPTQSAPIGANTTITRPALTARSPTCPVRADGRRIYANLNTEVDPMWRSRRNPAQTRRRHCAVAAPWIPDPADGRRSLATEGLRGRIPQPDAVGGRKHDVAVASGGRAENFLSYPLTVDAIDELQLKVRAWKRAGGTADAAAAASASGSEARSLGRPHDRPPMRPPMRAASSSYRDGGRWRKGAEMLRTRRWTQRGEFFVSFARHGAC